MVVYTPRSKIMGMESSWWVTLLPCASSPLFHVQTLWRYTTGMLLVGKSSPSTTSSLIIGTPWLYTHFICTVLQGFWWIPLMFLIVIHEHTLGGCHLWGSPVYLPLQHHIYNTTNISVGLQCFPSHHNHFMESCEALGWYTLHHTIKTTSLVFIGLYAMVKLFDCNTPLPTSKWNSVPKAFFKESCKAFWWPI